MHNKCIKILVKAVYNIVDSFFSNKKKSTFLQGNKSLASEYRLCNLFLEEFIRWRVELINGYKKNDDKRNRTIH